MLDQLGRLRKAVIDAKFEAVLKELIISDYADLAAVSDDLLHAIRKSGNFIFAAADLK